MRIFSPFKDYYDFVAHLYGGGDPRVVYARKRLSEEQTSVKLPPVPRDKGFDIIYEGVDDENVPTQDWAHLIVAGKMYLLTRPSVLNRQGERDYLYKVKSPEEAEDTIDQSLRRHRWGRARLAMKYHPDRFGTYQPFLVDFCRLVGAPVFIVRQENWKRRHLTIYDSIPNLGDLGMASLVPAEQMYQEIAYFMGNTINPSPDIKPPVEVSNNNKILSAGFDLRTSFRNCK